METNNIPSPADQQTGLPDKYTITGVIFSFLLLLAFLLLASPVLNRIFNTDVLTAQVMYVHRLLVWGCLGIIWLYAVKIEKKPFLPWQERNYGLIHAAVSVLALMGIIFVGCIIINIILFLLHQNLLSEKVKLLIALFKKDKFLLVFTALTAGIVEEFIFRGYMQPRLQSIFKKP